MSKKIVIFTDGASKGNPGPASIGAIIKDDAGAVLATVSEAIGVNTNNVAEYTAILRALQEARRFDADIVDCYLDSELVVRQMTGVYKIKDARLSKLAQQIRTLCEQTPSRLVKFSHVYREHNHEADALANAALKPSKKLGTNRA